MIASKLLFPSLAIGLAVAACDVSDRGNETAPRANEAAPTIASEVRQPTVAETLSGSADHAAFAEALQANGLIDIFRGRRAYTLFAPANAAFVETFGEARGGFISQGDRERLIERLSHHVVSGTFTTADISSAISRAPGGRAELATVTGDILTFSREGNSIVITDGSEVQARITASVETLSNGVIHSIDGVLQPES